MSRTTDRVGTKSNWRRGSGKGTPYGVKAVRNSKKRTHKREAQ